MAYLTLSSPRTFKNVSCCPANDASGRSSAVAEERTATEYEESPPDKATQASSIAWSKLG